MSLPMKAVDRLFERLAATYGSAWSRQWESVPITDVKAAWSHELAIYTGRLEAVAWALENLPERCPNVIEFRNLCRSAPAPATKLLPSPKADPERVKAELAKLASRNPMDRPDPKDWARRILARHEAGEKLNPTTLRFAREALRHHLMGAV
jgi:hypothetical protein